MGNSITSCLNTLQKISDKVHWHCLIVHTTSIIIGLFCVSYNRLAYLR